MRTPPFKTVSVLGVPIDLVTEDGVLRFVAERVASREPAQIVTINAEYVMYARRSADFMRVLREAGLRTADGMGVVWAARYRGGDIRRRVGGSDLVWSIARQAEASRHKVFLLGAAEGVADRAAQVLLRQHPNLIIAGTYSGSPVCENDDFQVALIRNAQPDVLMVAFGSPQQDFWIERTLGSLAVPVCIGVGGSFDYLAGVAKRAPRWMQDYGLDWLWRLIKQPRRWRRMMVLPRFALLAILSKE